jgi:aryl-alcohol dehydrogenase-like predicted oxidoreductase
MLHFSATNFIDTLDTAIAYGDSEICLGEVGTHDFKLVTKLPALPDGCADVSTWVQQHMNASLSRLGVTTIYGLLLHRSWQLLGPNGKTLHHALQAVKDNGQVEKLGISIYSPDELRALKPHYGFDLVQAPFNLVDRRLSSTDWLRRLKDDGVEVHTRSVFLQGLLLMSQFDRPVKFSPWDSLWQKWHRWLAERDVSAVQACLGFPLSFPEIDRVIVGADDLNQLAQIVDAANSHLIGDLPDLQCDDENLINPSNWPKL